MIKRELNVAVVGLGFVGLTLSVHVAKYHRVFGIELKDEFVSSIGNGKPPFFEVGLGDALNSVIHSGKMTAHGSTEGLPICDVVVLTIGTPIHQLKMNREILSRAVNEIAPIVNNDTLVIVRSTVFVGASRNIIQQNLRNLGKSPLIAMCPERTMEGKALKELIELPQIIGADFPRAREAAQNFFYSVGVEKAVLLESLEEAELAKLASNAFRDVVFSFANELAVVSEAHGLSFSAIRHAANFEYPRSNIPKAGLVGGPCLEKDSWILLEALNETDTNDSVVRSGRLRNKSITKLAVQRVAETLQRHQANGDINSVLVAGLAFKGTPETDDIRGSLAIDLVQNIRDTFEGVRVYGCDPFVNLNSAADLGLDEFVDTQSGVNTCDLIFVQHDSESLIRQLSLALENASASKFIYDFWNVLSVQERHTTLRLGEGSYH